MRRRTRIVVICCVVAAVAGAAATMALAGRAAVLEKSQSDLEMAQASCGFAATVRLDGDTNIFRAGPHALDCFNTAARECTSASIEVDQVGVDTGTTYVFRIEPGGAACHAVELSQYHSAIFGAGQLTSQSCGAMAVTSRGVTFSCGGQDVLIPAGQNLPTASCGSAVTHLVDGDTTILQAGPDTLNCFDTAARNCESASIQVTEMGVDTGTTYVFTIEPGGAACRATELSQLYSPNFGGSIGQVNSQSCGAIAVTSRGVTFNCGGRDVLIPAAVTTTR
jgi:hypothetical protein